MAREVAGYLLEEHAFADGVSAIWRARSTADPSQRAIIRVFDIPESGDFAGPLFAFREDTEAAAALTHAHVVKTLDVGWRGGDHTFVVSPYTPAVALGDHLRDGPLGVDHALRLLSPLAVALDAAVAMDMPHGALHPLSIWVEPSQRDDSQPRALLSGFGLHHILRVVAVRQRGGGVIDDFLYIAPELLRGGRPTSRSDQYALAGAFLHAVTGRPPYERDGLAALFSAHLFGPAGGDPRPQDENSEAIAEIMTRALAKNPDHRFDTCQQFVATVEQAWRLAPGTATADLGVRASEPAGGDLAAEKGRGDGAAPPVPGSPEPAAAPATPPPHVVRPLPVQRRRQRRARSRVAVLAAAGVVAGIVAVLVAIALISPPPADAPPSDSRALAAATSAPPSRAEGPPGMRWRQSLPAPPSELYATPAGVVAVTPTQVVVVDPDTGGVLDRIASAEPTTVTDDGGLVTTTGDGLQVHDIQDGSLQWQTEITGVRPPAEYDGTLYGVSNEAVPQLIATDAQSGRRLWVFPGEEPAFPADTAVAPADDFVYLADSQVVYGILPKGASVGADTDVIAANEVAPEPLCVWRVQADDDLWLSSLRAVADGVVVAERAGNVCMRRQSDGTPGWCLRVRGADRVEPTVLTTDTQVFVVTPTAVTGIDARTGEQMWVQEGQWGDAALGDGRLVVIRADGALVTLATSDGQMQMVDVTAEAGARPESTAPQDGSEPGGGSEPSVIAVDGDMLYAALDDGVLVNVDMSQQLVSR